MSDLPITREFLEEERDRLSLEIGRINLQLVETLPRARFTELMKRKKSLGLRHQECLIGLRKCNEERRETLAQAFMTTVIEMFDPQDVSEVWDRLYANYPHLKP